LVATMRLMPIIFVLSTLVQGETVDEIDASWKMVVVRKW